MQVHRFTPSKVDWDLCKICYEPSDAHPDDDDLDAVSRHRLPSEYQQPLPVS